jgi:sensor histidine kinase YesM
MLLQPLVENAVRHAIAPRASGGLIRIMASRADGKLELSVEDDGPGLAHSNGDGIGLANVRERLRHLYGDEQHLELSQSTLGGVGVRIRLPYRE